MAVDKALNEKLQVNWHKNINGLKSLRNTDDTRRSLAKAYNNERFSSC